MKKWLLLIIAALAMVSLWACGNTDSTSTEVSQPTPTSVVKDAKVVFEEWLAAAKSINSEQAHYKSTIDISMKGSSQPTTLAISGELDQKGNKRFDEVDITSGPMTQKMREYSFEKEVFVATMVKGQWVSQKATPAIYFNSLDVLAEMENLYRSGALIVEPGVERKLVSGEESNQVKLSADIAKLSQVDRKFILFIGALSNLPSAEAADAATNALKSFQARFCLLPNGVTLESESTLVFDSDVLPPDSVVSFHILTTITDYNVGAVISDSIFDLPPAPNSPTTSTGTAAPLLQLFTIAGAAMEPTLHDGDTVMGLLVTRELKRGDIVVFSPPDSPTANYVERIVGMPGETIEMKGGHVFINGAVLDEPYVLEPASYSFGPTAIAGGNYFILGDNRNHSRDSHNFGAVLAANIKFIIQLNK